MNEKRDPHHSGDSSRAARIARLIAEDFFGDRLDLASRDMSLEAGGSKQPTSSSVSGQRVEGQSWLSMPEVEAVHGLGGDDHVVRLFLTFISAMDRARDATQLWRAGMSLHREQPTIFDPHCTAGLSFGTLHEVLKSAGVSRRHSPDTRAWRQIATSLAVGPESPVRRVVYTGRGDAQELLRDLKTRDERGRSRFPMLRGPKVGPMWVRMMVSPGRAVIDRIETIPVAVDVQVRRVTENLGVTATCGVSLRKAKPVIHQAWMDAVSEADFGGPPGIAGTCAALDPALWFFGRHGCGHCEKAGRKLRFGRACDHCLRFGNRNSAS